MNQRIAIIGAGPAGLAAAAEALRLGMKAALFERGRVGEGIRCAEGFFDPLRLLAPPSLLHNGFTGNCRVEFPEVAK